MFLSRYLNKIDKKARVSVPAAFRAIVDSAEFNGVVAYSSFKNKCIEVCTLAHLTKLGEFIAKLDPYSPERDAFEAVVFGGAMQLSFDNEGRINLPINLLENAEIETGQEVCFIGKGQVFEIWQVNNFNDYLQQAREIAQTNRSMLKNI